MPQHHFIPVFILRNFACKEAWRLVRAPSDTKRRVALHDETVLHSRNPRNWPLCVLDKATGTLQRKKLADVCSRANFYSLPQPEDPLMRGIIRLSIRFFEDPARLTPISDQDLPELGREPLDLEEIERLRISAIDGQFARLVGPLRSGADMSIQDMTVIIRFVVLARYRTPFWRETYYPRVFQDTVGHIRRQARLPGAAPWAQLTANEEEALTKELERSLYQLAIMGTCIRDHSALNRTNTNVLVLHSVGTSKFVAADNPARPFFPSPIKHLPSQPFPAIDDPNLQMLYPISPDACLLLTKRPDLPHFSHQEVKGNPIKEINTILAITARGQVVLPESSPHFFLPWLDVRSIPTTPRP